MNPGHLLAPLFLGVSCVLTSDLRAKQCIAHIRPTLVNSDGSEEIVQMEPLNDTAYITLKAAQTLKLSCQVTLHYCWYDDFILELAHNGELAHIPFSGASHTELLSDDGNYRARVAGVELSYNIVLVVEHLLPQWNPVGLETLPPEIPPIETPPPGPCVCNYDGMSGTLTVQCELADGAEVIVHSVSGVLSGRSRMRKLARERSTADIRGLRAGAYVASFHAEGKRVSRTFVVDQ